ncbi:hypothetical protein V8F20_007273 [Naviculisporaceae sp. PSN 640]
MSELMLLAESSATAILFAVFLLFFIYLVLLNQLLNSTPEEVRRLSPQTSRWTKELLQSTYQRLEQSPITTTSYARQIPPKLARRYIVTGGSGLVGGYIVLQLLERGQPPEAIRIVDLRAPKRHNMVTGPASQVEFIQTDISSVESTQKAFSKAWHPSVASLPLTVFHVAAVIVPSERSKLLYKFCESINVHGTQNVVDAARQSGADIFISTTSGSISIKPIKFWIAPWKLWDRSGSKWPEHFWQILDDKDFYEPLRPHEGYFANYPASKAAAERLVCGANSQAFRTGCIRPANGVYGNPTDNTLGGSLNAGDCPSWNSHIIQSFVHGINVALAHLYLEAVLSSTKALPSQSGRPFIVTDPNPPITYGDLLTAVSTLATTHFRVIPLPPVLILLLSHVIEWYIHLPLKYPILRKILPPITGDAKFLQPAIMDICTHLVASNEKISRPVEEGGLGFKGVITTLEGMVQEIVEWNQEHSEAEKAGRKVVYHISIELAAELENTGTENISSRSNHT